MNRALVHMGPFLGWSTAWLAVCVLVVAVLGGRSSAAPDDAAGYKTYKDEVAVDLTNKKTLNELAKQRNQFITGTMPLSGNESTFEDIYNKYVFPVWTLTDADHLGTLAKERERFLSVDLGKSSQAVHDRLTTLTLAYQSRVAKDKALHPGVRYNAVLILGALNSREADRVNKANPEPLSAAMKDLNELFKSADDSDAVRVAALLGILRHLEWDDFRKQSQRMAPGDKAAIVKDLISLAQASDPPPGRSPEGHTWMRRRAVEGLMYACQTETTLEIAGVIEKLIASEADPIALRCTAADVMGRLDYKAPVIPAPDTNAKELGYLALVACNVELNRLQEESKSGGRHAPPPSGFAPGGMGVAGGGMGGARGMGAMMGGMMGGVKPKGAPEGPSVGGMMGGMMPGKGGKNKQKAKKDSPKVPDLLAPANNPAKAGSPKKDDPDAQRLEALRRRLRAWLYAVQIGLGDEKANPENRIERSFGANGAVVRPVYNRGVAAHAEQRLAYVQEVIAGVQSIASVVEAPDLDREDFIADLRKEMKILEGITKPLPVPKDESIEPAGDAPGLVPTRAASAPATKADDAAAAEVPTVPSAATKAAPADESKEASPAPAETKSP